MIRKTGILTPQPTGYTAFVPAALPPHPPIELDNELQSLTSDAALAVGRLDGMVHTVPDSDFFVAMYVRREAVLSAQIEGTQSSLEDLLEVELRPKSKSETSDVSDIVNYVRAMNRGLGLLNELPVCLRLIRELHIEVVRDTRGGHAYAGEFRRTQNWIGRPGSTLKTATFVPPPVTEMHQALNDLERFLNARSGLPSLVETALIHAQFEAIHPFLDGNGRVGRLLITLILIERGLLKKPLLYLSWYLKQFRAEYYQRLQEIRTDGNWEAWIRFFLTGIRETAREAAATAERLFQMREEHQIHVVSEAGPTGLQLLSELYRHPVSNISNIATALDVGFNTAKRLVHQFVELGLLTEITGLKRDRIFRYDAYVSIFDDASSEHANTLRVVESA